MKIAIIGSGISGLTCAHYLQRKHEVSLFEKNAYFGGHTHTHQLHDGYELVAVDSGFIVFNEKTYPQFCRLLAELGVSSHESDMSFSFRSDVSGLEYNGTRWRTLFAQKRNVFSPSFLRMLFGIARFNRMALRWLKAPRHDQSLGSFLREAGIPRQTVDRYVLPMGAAVWSTSPANMFHMPAAFFLSFFENHGFLSINDRPRWRVVTGGSKTYVSALLKAFKGTLHRQNEVVSVRRDDEGCTVVDRKGAQHRFDQVVFACHSDEALGLLSDASLDERQILGAIPYASNRVLIHSDPSFMPRRRLAWASWNYLTSQTNRDQLCVTYHMNRLQQFKADEEFFVTLNPPRAVARGTLIKELTYHHPQFVEGSAEAQASWKVISGHRRTHFCGAYWRYGFHEDGVWSALRVCQALGAIDD